MQRVGRLFHLTYQYPNGPLMRPVPFWPRASRWRDALGQKEAARGIFVFDRKQSDEANMQALHQTFKHVGHANGRLCNFAEVPLFIDSKASRLIQLADTVCYWIYRRYEAGDDHGWAFIDPYFAKLGNGRTGLHEVLDPDTPGALANIQPSPYPFPPAQSALEPPALGIARPPVVPQPRVVPSALIRDQR